jgi:glycogen synthase
MRILFITNYYPPLELGGWEQLCQETVNALAARGHTVLVLTSRFRRESLTQTEAHVHRKLFLESDPYHYRPLSVVPYLLRRDAYNLNCLRSTVSEYRPDVVFIWGMWLLNPQLAVLAEDLCPGRVAFYLAGFWPANDFEGDPHTVYWKLSSNKPWVRQIKKSVAWAVTRTLRQRRARSPQFAHVACVSRFVLEELRRRGLALPAGRVIYNGIDLARFYCPAPDRRSLKPDHAPLRLLFAGTISPEKGPDTAVEAIARLSGIFGDDRIHLTLIGTGSAHFVDYLKKVVQERRLTSYVTFSGWVVRETMPQRLRDFDAMLFTSTWQEPLARAMMEGMAAGLALVSTTTGGTAEFLKHDVNALTFAAGDPDDLATQIKRLLDEPGLAERIAAGAQQTALTHFAFNRMADEIEAFLGELIQPSWSEEPA